MTTEQHLEPLDVHVFDVRRLPPKHGTSAPHVVVLEDDGGRLLPIWMGGFEGTSIALALEHADPPRPLTFAFMADVVAATGGRLRDVAITRLEKNTFYAVANIEDGEHRIVSVDARPSDAIALAMHMGSSIRVWPEVFDAQGAHDATHPDEALKRERIGEARSGAAEIVAAVKGVWAA